MVISSHSCESLESGSCRGFHRKIRAKCGLSSTLLVFTEIIEELFLTDLLTEVVI